MRRLMRKLKHFKNKRRKFTGNDYHRIEMELAAVTEQLIQSVAEMTEE